MAALAPAYLPRRPTETVLYGLVRQHLESFLAYAKDNYERGLPRYVEDELRAFLTCGVFSNGFVRARCDQCGFNLLVAFTCKSRTLCPSCAGRRMSNTGATIVDRVLPEVPVRQYVLSLPFDLRRLAAFNARVLTALGRIFVESLFGRYRAWAKQSGREHAQCGAINFVQRFGSSLNLNVHFHLVVPDGVWTRRSTGGVEFHPAPPPTREELRAVVERVQRRAIAWLRRHGPLRGKEEPLQEPPAQTALDACAAIAMARGQTATLASERELAIDSPAPSAGFAGAVEVDGFNLHADVSIKAGDDAGREKLCRYAARPALSLARLRRLHGGRVAYHLKYVRGSRGKYRSWSRWSSSRGSPPSSRLRGTRSCGMRVCSHRTARGARTLCPARESLSLPCDCAAPRRRRRRGPARRGGLPRRGTAARRRSRQEHRLELRIPIRRTPMPPASSSHRSW